MFPVIEVGPDAPVKSETMGTKRKFWFQHPELKFSLFKLARQGTGEDWSEKIAEQLCQMLGLPHARYELAVSAEGPGVVTPSFVPNPDVDRLLPGNELLEVVSGYAASGNKYHNSQHTLDLVLKPSGSRMYSCRRDGHRRKALLRPPMSLWVTCCWMRGSATRIATMKTGPWWSKASKGL